MSADRTRLRARADVAAGRHTAARARLLGLASTYPTDLSVRAELAASYRLRRNKVEAGRWDYLADTRLGAEVAAFERATADPRVRAVALRWKVEPSAAPTQVARQRLDELLDELRAVHGDGIDYQQLFKQRWSAPLDPRTRLADAAWCAGLLVVGSVLLVGLVRVLIALVRWMVP